MSAVKFRPHRRLLDEAMAEVVEIDGMEALVDHLNRTRFGPAVKAADIAVEPYGFDNRIGWDTYIVTANGHAVGFSDGPIPNPRRQA